MLVEEYLGNVKHQIHREPNSCNSKKTPMSESTFKKLNESSKLGILSFVNENLVGWSSRKQQRVCTSVTESEILSILDAVNEVEYMVSLINELKINSNEIQLIAIFNDKCKTLVGDRWRISLQ